MDHTREPKPPRNRDQELPKRQGDNLPGTTEPGADRTDRNERKPLPEEETYEREPSRRNLPEG